MSQPTLTFNGIPLCPSNGETVLECLERHGHGIPAGCRAGACQSCLLQDESGPPPRQAQIGLSKQMIGQNLFLACQAKAVDLTSVCTPKAGVVQKWAATVTEIESLHDDVTRIALAPESPIPFQHGQFLKLTLSNGLTRSYSIANSALEPPPEIEFHVRHVPNGAMSAYIAQELRSGDVVQLQGPLGAMEYDRGHPEKNLLLIGSGTGLAPLYSLATAALAQGHRGEVRLYHGGDRSRALYFRSEVTRLASKFGNFSYVPCADHEVEYEDRAGSPVTLAIADQADYSDWRVFAAGHPAMVKAAQKRLYLAGASLRDITCDPFTDQSLPT